MRGLGALALVAVALSACLSSASLSGAGPGDCTADLLTDVGNCGRCGHVCPNLPNAYGKCEQGDCKVGCNTGFADCDGITDTGCEVALASDAKHCGACGVDCGGGRCRDSLCQPVALATVAGEIESLTQDANFLYAGVDNLATGTNNNSVVRIAKNDGAIQDLVATLAAPPEALVNDGTNVYLVQRGTTFAPAPDGTVLRVPKAGGSQVVASNQGFDEGCCLDPVNGHGGGPLGVDGGFLYWLTGSGRMSGGQPTGPTGALRRCALPACTVIADVATGFQGPSALLIDGATAFVANEGTVAAPNTGRDVYRCAVSGCGTSATAMLIPADFGIVRYLAQDTTSLFLAGIGAVARISKSGTGYARVATSRGSVTGLAVARERIVWADSLADSLLSCPVMGCSGAPDEIPLNAQPNALVADENAIFVAVTSGQASTILRVVP